MKKRVLSALLALSMLLTPAPAAYAAEPATQSGGAEIDWPEPTCTVDYKPQSKKPGTRPPSWSTPSRRVQRATRFSN